MRLFTGQKLEIQIPQENTSTRMNLMPKTDDEKLNEFLKNNFEIPSNNTNEISKFINQDLELKRIITNLPNIISKELPYRYLSLDFMKEADPSEKILEITIFSKLEEETLLEKEDRISDDLIDNYQTFNEYIILVEPYVEL